MSHLLLAGIFDMVQMPVAVLGIDIEKILEQAGPWALAVVTLIVFIESGVLFPFLPGDSLLFTLGLIHVQLGLNLWVMILCLCIAAVAGDQVGYYLGHRFGRRFFSADAKVLNTKNLHAAESFFEKYGGKALVLARFVPIVRTFVPLAAGIAKYRYRDFAKWNITGAITWVFTLVFAGVLLGGIPFIRDNVEAIVIVIVVASVLPVGVEYLRERRKAHRSFK
ncbi:VTT domain-containing protein [Rothia sp. P7181]|uniref:VTT domain-containing protein n=1 Tax=unclassified Rothia (in: high G+C Gram-positive bacteria) TaxID=2689056 RepID=UPI003AE24CC6